MKRIKQLEKLAIGLALLMFFQSCTVYKSANVSLAEAAQANTKTKVEFKDGEKEKYSRVFLHDNGSYYGIKKEKYQGSIESYKLQIKEDNISRVQVKDKFASIIIFIGVPAALFGIAALIVSQNFNLTN